MFRPNLRRWVILVFTLALVALVPVGASAQTQSDVDAAERNKRVAEARKSQAYQDYVAVTQRLDEAVEEYEIIHAEHEDLQTNARRHHR